MTAARPSPRAPTPPPRAPTAGRWCSATCASTSKLLVAVPASGARCRTRARWLAGRGVRSQLLRASAPRRPSTRQTWRRHAALHQPGRHRNTSSSPTPTERCSKRPHHADRQGRPGRQTVDDVADGDRVASPPTLTRPAALPTAARSSATLDRLKKALGAIHRRFVQQLVAARSGERPRRRGTAAGKPAARARYRRLDASDAGRRSSTAVDARRSPRTTATKDIVSRSAPLGDRPGCSSLATQPAHAGAITRRWCVR